MSQNPGSQTGEPMTPEAPDKLSQPLVVIFGRAFGAEGVVAMLVVGTIVGVLERLVASKASQFSAAGEVLWPGLSMYIGLFILVAIAFAAFSKPRAAVRSNRNNSESDAGI